MEFVLRKHGRTGFSYDRDTFTPLGRNSLDRERGLGLAEDIMSTETLTYRGVKYKRTYPTKSIYSVWVSKEEIEKELKKSQAKLEPEQVK